MQITRGKIKSAEKVVIYGSEGIGKTTFAARFPSPLFIDTEGSTKHMDVARLPNPQSWEQLCAEIKYVTDNPNCCKTLVIDTIDWAEQLCLQYICSKYNKASISEFGYGNGYVYEKESFERFLKRLNGVIDSGINVVLTAHSQIKRFEQPDEMGAYDRYELKLGQKTTSQISPLIKEWTDMLLFANYKTISVATDDKGKKHKAQGGRRVMYTTHHPCWDAKNRHGLADELPFEFDAIKHLFGGNVPISDVNNSVSVTTVPVSDKSNVSNTSNVSNNQDDDTKRIEAELEAAVEMPVETIAEVSDKVSVKQEEKPQSREISELLALMQKNNVTRQELQNIVADKGYFPADTPIENYNLEFISEVLIKGWEQVYKAIALNSKLPWEK